MREMKCPVCGGEVPRALLRSQPFVCPTCKEPLRSREFSPLLGFPIGAVFFSLAFVIAERMGMKGWGLIFATLFLGPAAGFVVSAVIVLALAWVFGLPPPLERDPGPVLNDGGVLHIESAPRPRKGTQ